MANTNKEDYLDALTAYSKSSSRDIPAILEQYLNDVAKNGETLFHWQLLKPLIVGKMDQVIEELRQRLSSEYIPERPNVENVRFDVMHDRIMDALNKFNGAPFTIQRLCELLIDPKQHYRRSDKFLRGLEKNVLVVSTVDPYGRKVVSESGIKHLVNGIDTNGSPFFPRDSNITSNLPPVPGWVTTPALTRSLSTAAEDALEEKPSEQASANSSVAASGDEPGNILSSLDVDQKEPAVHAEVVVEETVVTMDTSEAGTVATDGGEAMAEVDDNEEEMVDDTSASSSSSSPEELPVSDTGESSTAQMETNSAVTSSTSTTTWTSVTTEAESMDTSSDCNLDSSDSPASGCNPAPSDSPASDCNPAPSDSPASDCNPGTSDSPTSDCNPGTSDSPTSDCNPGTSDSPSPTSDCNPGTSDSPVSSHNLHPSSDQQKEELPLSSEANSSQEEHSEKNYLTEDFAESSSESTSCRSHQQESLSNSCSSVSTSESAPPENAVSPNDSQCRGFESGDSCNVTASGVESDSSPIDIDDVPSSTASSSSSVHVKPHESSSSSDVHVKPHESSSSNTSNFTEAIASSSTDSLPSDTPLVCAETHDSVAGLEKLVDSVDPSVLQSPLSSVSTLPPLTRKQEENSESSPSSSSLDSLLDSEEPETKHRKLSHKEEACSSSSCSEAKVSASSEIEASSSHFTSVKLDIMADTTSDSTAKTLNATSGDQNAELHESPNSVSCSEEELDDPSIVSSENETSQPAQSSPSDSQGFDVIENTFSNNSAEDRQNEEVQPQATTDVDK